MIPELPKPPPLTPEFKRWLWAEIGQRRTEERRDGEVITEGGRDKALASLAGSMRRRGMSENEISSALTVVNRDRCVPPMDERDVRRIARSVSAYAADADVLRMVEIGEHDPVHDEDPDVQPDLELLTLKALCQIEVPEQQSLLGPLVLRGRRTIIAAPTGEGKSTLVYWWMRAMVTGEYFLEWQGCRTIDGEPVRILVIDAEQVIADIQRLATETDLRETEQIALLVAPDGLDIEDGSKHAQAIERMLEEFRPHIIVADPLYKLHRSESNDERPMVDLMRIFDRWRTSHDCALILPAHTRKVERKFAKSVPTIDDIFGSSSISRGAEVVVTIKQRAPGKSAMTIVKHRSGLLPKGTHYEVAFDRNAGYRVLDDSMPAMERRELQLHQVITGYPEGIDKETLLALVGNKYGWGKSVCDKVLGEARKAGLVTDAEIPGSNRRRIYYPAYPGDTEDEQMEID